MNRFSLGVTVLLASAYQAEAGDFVNFQSFDTSLYLQNENRVDPQKTLSPIVEAFGDYSIGDMYVYSIWQNSLQSAYQGDNSTYYYKIVPRLSYSKITGQDISYGWFKDLTFAQWIARTKGADYDYFAGIGLDWQTGWISWLRTLFYYEYNPSKGWNDQRLHIDYGVPFSLGENDFRVVGTFDYTFGLHGQTQTIDFKPELHYDLGKKWGNLPGHLWTGIVLNPIKNKYKIKDSPYFATNQFSYGVFIRYSFF
ncbi:outer membrane protein OmpK [Biostraticola tofi]|uniref:Nucleoside-specific outer membrane channel protein Tsx n=1 Tax=Biostraticola tofi TaxID=466109 RepID=A0A4R3Z6L6_9GAMM|nr:outer membrane protein OmpK [Biostraticola tofi]TCV99840.1 nucleoside-specific outer membrane channel protein Tsx [Biostraticola tofi]